MPIYICVVQYNSHMWTEHLRYGQSELRLVWIETSALSIKYTPYFEVKLWKEFKYLNNFYISSMSKL